MIPAFPYSPLTLRQGFIRLVMAKDDADRISCLLRELGDPANRAAQFVCAIAIANPDGEIVFHTEGICLSKILNALQGES
jgi:XTP/dITP diphosphohydrolase